MRWTNLTRTALDAVATMLCRHAPVRAGTTATNTDLVVGVVLSAATPHGLLSARPSGGTDVVPTEVRQVVDTTIRPPGLVGLTGGGPRGGGRWPDPDGPPVPVHQVAEWAAQMCDELAGLAEQGFDRSTEIHAALDEWDLSAVTRAALTQGVTLRHIAGVLGDMHTRLDEIAHRVQVSGGAW